METAIFDEFGNEIIVDTSKTKQEDVNAYQRQVQEFQQSVLALDTAAYGLRMLLDLDLTDDQRIPILEQLGALEQKKGQIRTAAETVNGASYLANQLGITLPRVNVQTLGALPLVPLAVAAGIATAAGLIFNLIGWIRDWVNNAAVLTKTIEAAADLPPDQKARVLEAVASTETAKAQTQSGLSSISNIVKYIAFAAAAYFAYQAFVKSQK